MKREVTGNFYKEREITNNYKRNPGIFKKPRGNAEINLLML
jgi:hypothetical protein